MDVTLIDSPVANTANISRALSAAGARVTLTADAAAIRAATKLVLPGVGSFKAAMSWLVATGNDRAIHDAVSRGAALLGICVGHQLLFEGSDEAGWTPGLGLIRGNVRRIASTMPVPHIGWNRVRWSAAPPLFRGVESPAFYFVHSYASAEVEDEVAHAVYGVPFTASVQRQRVFGVQFHPEKSSTAGLRVLRNFVELAWD